jgi:hypothetical protein
MNTRQMLDHLAAEPLPRSAIYTSDQERYVYVARMAGGRFVCTVSDPYEMREFDTTDALAKHLDALHPDGMCWIHRPIEGLPS